MMHVTDEPTARLAIAGKEFFLLPPNRNLSLSCYSLNLSAIQSFVYAFLEQHGDPFRTASDTRIRDDTAKIVRHLGKIEIPRYQPDVSNTD